MDKNGGIFLGLYVFRYNVIIIYERGELTYITEWFTLNGSEGKKWMENGGE